MSSYLDRVNGRAVALRGDARADWNMFFIAASIFAAGQAIELLLLAVHQKDYLSLCNWDCGWYTTIVEHGYDIEPHGHSKGDAANWAFFPALPMIAKALFHLFDFSAAGALIVTGKVFFFLSIFWFMKLVRLYSPQVPAWLAGVTVAFSPYAIYGNVGYTEPLFLFSTCSFFCFLKRKEFVASGLCGAFLTSTRFVGLAAVCSYAVSTIRQFHSRHGSRPAILLGLLLIPLGLAIFMLMLYLVVGDSLAFSHVQRAWGRAAQNPLWIIDKGLRGSAFDVYSTVTALAALLLSLVLLIQRRPELMVFSLICSALPLMTGLWSLPRYVWWQAPLLLLVAELLHRTRSAFLAIPAALAGLWFMYGSWFAGKEFVI